MAADFQELIQKNKRNSWLLVAGFVLFIGLLGGVIGCALTGDPAGAVPVIAIAVLAGLFSAALSYYGGASAVLSMSRAREIEKSDDPQLLNVVEEMAIASGLPMPRVYVIDDSAPNAFATGRDPRHAAIAVTSGLRAKLNREELQGVIAHEMSHIRNLDIRFAVLMATLVGIVVLLCDLFLRSLRWGRFAGSSRSSRSRRGGGAIVLVVILLAIVLSIIAPMLAKLIEMAFSRQREYLADASAVDLTRNPCGLASALSKISMDPEVLEVANRATAPLYIVHPIKHFEDRSSSILDSHPPIKDRIARLLSMSGGFDPQAATTKSEC